MTRRPTSTLLLLALVSQLLVPAVPVFAAKADPATGKTGLALPTIGQRLGLSDTALPEAAYTPLRPDQEPGALRSDGSFSLPSDYVENPAFARADASDGMDAKAVAQVPSTKGGTVMRADVSGDITASTTWTLANSPYVVTGTINVQSPAVLTIEPGVVVKFASGANLLAQAGATLTANGTAQAPITFTSLKDDTVAGDTNGDGDATAPAPGDWAALGYAGYKDTTAHAAFGSMQFAVVRYGAQLQSRFSMPTLADDTISEMSTAGLYLDTPPSTTYTIQRLTVTASRYNLWLYAVPSTTTIQNSAFRGAYGFYAILAQSSTAARLTSNSIDYNGNRGAGFSWAISAASSPMVLRYNSIVGNQRADGTTMGLSASGSTVDAQYNWWGSTSGPAVTGQAATGGGSTISATLVTFTNWLGSAFEAEHKKGTFPWTIKAGTGADVATGNFTLTERDIAIPTIGQPLQIVRTYNNQTAATVTGDFGNGWTWNLGTSLNLTPDTYGGVVWEQPDGAKDYFKKNPVDGSYTSEDGIYSRLSYDAAASTYTLTHKDQTQWVFSSTGKLIRLVDTDGNATIIARDGTGKVLTVTEPTGRVLTFLYTGSKISRITDPLGRTYNYSYSSYGGVSGLTGKEPDGTTVFTTCSYTYVGSYAMTSYTDCDGNAVTQTFDASKRVATQALNGATALRFVYGPATDPQSGLVLPQYTTGVWDSYSKAHIFFYTKSNKVTEHWRENVNLGSSYVWYYEDLWSYISYVSSAYRDIEQKTTTSTYDLLRGNVLSTTAPGNRTTTNTYDAFNNRTSATDPLGRVTEFAYDAEQHLIQVTDALQHDTTTTYTAAGLPETVTDARGKVTSFTYDAWGYPATVTNAAGETLTFSYDAGGRKLWEETPEHARTTYTYSGRDQVLTATDPLTHVTTSVYDASGRKTQVTDPAGRVTHYDYQRNALWKTTDAKTGLVTLTLNGQGNVASVTDASNHTTTFTYDAFGRQITVTDPNNKTQSTEYTSGGRISKTIDAANAQTTYTYTQANDLDVVTYPDSRTLHHTYDGAGKRLTMTDWVGTHTYGYDALNRVTSATDGAGNAIGYGYDAVGNLTTLTYPDTRVVTYTFDDANRMATVTDWDDRVTTYAYDASGRIGSFTLPNGVVTTYGYDDVSRVAHVDHTKDSTTLADRDYTYDALGNRLTKGSAAGTDTYTYDELYRITGVSYADGASVAYTYDATGNRTTQTAAGGTTNYTYDIADQLLAAGDGTRTYDANGQLTRIGASRGFTWDVRGKLTQITDSPANSAPTANAGTNRSVYVNQLVILDGRASSDPEAEALTFSWTEDATNPASGLLQGAHAPQPGITPTIAGTYGFHLTVSDGVNTSAPAAVTVTVQAGIPPTQTLTSTATSATSGYTWTNGTRQFSADLFTGKSGSTAYDGVAQFVLPTTPAGLVLSSAALDLTGKSSTSPTVNDAWIVALLPTSVDGTWTTLTWAMINGATPDATLTPILTGLNQVVANVVNHWDFTSADLAVVQSRLTGSGKLSIRTQGNGASSSASVRWYGGNATNATQRPKLTLVFTPVPQTDHAPIARAGADQRVAPGALVTLQGQDSYDYEGAVASFAWTQIGGAAVTLSAPTDAAPIFTPPAAGTYRFQLVVTDAASQASASDEVVVSVATPPPHVTSYVYDGEGDRIAQTNDGVTTSYVVNSLPKLGEVLAETTSDETTLYVYGQDLLYTLTSTGPHYHHTDGLGSTIAVTNAAGTVEQTMDYDVFGTLRSMTGSSGTTRTFTGEENDAAGLVYLRARFYDPSVGRFLSRDPFPAQATDTQTLNRYVYVKNNPTNYVDPSGESAEEAFRDILWWLLAPTQTADESVCELPTPGEYQNAVTSGSRLGILIGGAAGLRLLVRGTLAFKASFNYALQPSKLGHIFGNSDHLLDPLVKQLGGQQQVVKEVLVQLPSLPKGVFEGVRVMVNDTTVVVSGYVDDGIVKIGTMYVPR